MSIETSIIVKTDFAGLHYWPEGPPPVSFLRRPHRHRFFVEARIEVHHSDRELEILQVQGYLNRKAIPALSVDVPACSYADVWALGEQSCEQLAAQLTSMLVREYGERRMTVSVLEDGENGAVVEYTPQLHGEWEFQPA